ncbi:MAG: pseudouridine synthase [Nevskiales bacterium]
MRVQTRQTTAHKASLIIALNKPYGVLCQFRDDAGRSTLADYLSVKDVYPAGRLDTDSEGLVLLTNDGVLQNRISDPRHKLWKTYLVQVEGRPDELTLNKLRSGVLLKDGPTLPARVTPVGQPDWLWPRTPPIRYRAAIPTSWMELQIHEGRNRQVRRMTAAIGHPSLRLIRYAIGLFSLEQLAPGQWRELASSELNSLLGSATSDVSADLKQPRRPRRRIPTSPA